MFEKVLSKKAQAILALLGKQTFAKNFYLAGGTGLALYLGHRKSIDLDFFSSQEFDPKKIIFEISKLGKFNLTQESWGTVNGKLNNVQISFLFYQHKLLKPALKYQNIKIAAPIDIGLMKITAVSSRGSKKDFVDLYFISQKIISLSKLFALLPKKFKEVNYEAYHLLRALTYFKDAEQEPMPKMLKKISWPEIKKFFQNQTIILAKNLTNS